MRNLLSFAALAVVGSLTACSASEEEEHAKKPSSWTCERADVPMGEVTRCTQAGTGATTTPTPPPENGGGAVGLRTYGTPPSGESGGGGGSSETAPSPYECASGSSDCPNADDAPLPPASETSPAGPDECTYTPEETPYCKAPPPAGGTPGPWSCSKDGNGNKTCESQPSCAPGTHPTKCGCAPDGQADECLPPAEGGCWVTGGGFIVEPSVVPGAPADGHDNYGGNAKQMKQGGVSGHWNHVDHGTMNHAKGRPEYLFCRHVDEPGPGQPGGRKGLTSNQVYFGGPAEWRSNGQWEGGYWFDVVAKDHGEPGSQPSPKNGYMVDTYHFTIRKMVDVDAKVSGPVVYEVKGGLVGGNIQIHPSNNGHPGRQSPLPAWVALEP